MQFAYIRRHGKIQRTYAFANTPDFSNLLIGIAYFNPKDGNPTKEIGRITALVRIPTFEWCADIMDVPRADATVEEYGKNSLIYFNHSERMIAAKVHYKDARDFVNDNFHSIPYVLTEALEKLPIQATTIKTFLKAGA